MYGSPYQAAKNDHYGDEICLSIPGFQVLILLGVHGFPSQCVIKFTSSGPLKAALVSQSELAQCSNYSCKRSFERIVADVRVP